MRLCKTLIVEVSGSVRDDLGSQTKQERIERRSNPEVGQRAKELGGMVLLLNRIVLQGWMSAILLMLSRAGIPYCRIILPLQRGMLCLELKRLMTSPFRRDPLALNYDCSSSR